VQVLGLACAEAADHADVPDGMSISAELARRPKVEEALSKRKSAAQPTKSAEPHSDRPLEQYRLRLTNRAIKLLAKTKG
jgi:hypothetical protein